MGGGGGGLIFNKDISSVYAYIYDLIIVPYFLSGIFESTVVPRWGKRKEYCVFSI